MDHGSSASEAAKEETPADREGEEGDQAAEEACRRGSFSDPALIHDRCGTEAMHCECRTLIGSLVINEPMARWRGIPWRLRRANTTNAWRAA